jgi:hypothetical protein
MEFVIENFITAGFFSIDTLNDMIARFPYLQSDKVNKPSLIPHSGIPKQTAAQMWCLARLFPLIIGHTVPPSNSVWLTFLRLLDIVDLACAPAHTNVSLSYLQYLVNEFLQMYVDLGGPLKPKFHYMLHYASQIHCFGPLVTCWTLRFEGKHNYFKEIACRSKNKQNICATLAKRHQLNQCFTNAASHRINARDNITSSHGQLVSLTSLLPVISEYLQSVGVAENAYQVNSCTFGGVVYNTGACVICGIKDGRLQFAVVRAIFLVADVPHLQLTVCQEPEYHGHYHCYIVTPSSNVDVIQPVTALYDFHPLGLYDTGSEYSCVVIKHRCPGERCFEV